MAEGYTVSDDGRTYLIKLRDGLKFHDGEPVRAQDCAPSLARWAVRDTFGQTAAKSVDTWGVRGRQDHQDHAEAAVPAADRCDRRRHFVHHAGAAGEDRSVQGGDRRSSAPVRSGSSRTSSCRAAAPRGRSSTATCRARSRRNGPRAARSRTSSASSGRSFPDASTASAALQTGEVDWYEQAQHDLVPLLRANPDIVIGPSNPQGYIGGMRFNCIQPPFNDVRLRRAVMAAVNQEDYMRAIMGDDHSAWQVCRSQYPCGTTYGTRGRPAGAEGRSGSREEDDQGSRLQRPEGGDHQSDGLCRRSDRSATSPTTCSRRSASMRSCRTTDWGTVVQRRASKEPVDKGGWSVFHTWFTGGFILNPVVTAPFRAQGAGRVVRLVRQSEGRADDAGVAGREGRRRAQEDRRGDPAGELRAGADDYAGAVPDPDGVSQEPGGQAGIHRAAVLEREAGA